MKELMRLKTTTSRGKVFYSPFVFKREEAERRVKSAAKTFEERTGNETELIGVRRYPQTAVWCLKKHGKHKKNIDSLILHIRRVEFRWEMISDCQ